MTFEHGNGLTAAIRKVVRNSPADIAVAYWGHGACNILQLPQDLNGYRIICDARSGFCSAKALGDLLDRGASIVDLPMLHAKVYRSQAMMVVASANVSMRGLPDTEIDPGLEAGFVVSDPEPLSVAKGWFDRAFDTAFKSGGTVGPDILPEIESIWNRQRATRPLRTSLIDALLNPSSDLTERPLRVYVYSASSPTSTHQERYKATKYYDREAWEKSQSYPFFWGEFPGSITMGDDLLCFEVAGRSARCEGVWKILDRIGTGAATIWPSAPIAAPLGWPLGSTTAINKWVAAAIAGGRLAIDGEPMSLPAFATAIAVPDADNGWASHLDRIKTEPARAAYRHLVGESAALRLSPRFYVGRVPALEWRDERERYLFSFIPNRTDLLFYLRGPALSAVPDLPDQIRALGFETKRNSRDEETFRIATVNEAATVAGLLRRVLPLP